MSTPPNLFPSSYRSSKASWIPISAALTAVFLLGVFGRAHVNLAKLDWVEAIIILGGVAAIISISADFATARVTLYADRIEKTSLFGKKTWKRDDIAMSRTSQAIVFPLKISVLVHKHNSGYRLILPLGVKEDAAWHIWMDSLPSDGGKHAR
jgi:hypothetical protein